jgi:acyl-CoA thioesterase
MPHITPQEVLNTMRKSDRFTDWLGLQIDRVDLGYCKLHYTVKHEMLNGFDYVHGGVLFSAADSAFAFACNSHGILSVALDVSITFTRPAKEGEILFVEAKELYVGSKTGLYDVLTTNSEGALVAAFKGTSFRTGKLIG